MRRRQKQKRKPRQDYRRSKKPRLAKITEEAKAEAPKITEEAKAEAPKITEEAKAEVKIEERPHRKMREVKTEGE